MAILRKLAVIFVALAVALPAAATSVSGVKVTRIRRGTSNDVFVQVSVPPATLDCNGTFVASEVYVYDGDTTAGRILDAIILAAYSANKTVDITGTGTCRTYGVNPFTTRFENVSNAVIR